jgi:hypothetical protein
MVSKRLDWEESWHGCHMQLIFKAPCLYSLTERIIHVTSAAYHKTDWIWANYEVISPFNMKMAEATRLNNCKCKYINVCPFLIWTHWLDCCWILAIRVKAHWHFKKSNFTKMYRLSSVWVWLRHAYRALFQIFLVNVTIKYRAEPSKCSRGFMRTLHMWALPRGYTWVHLIWLTT